MIALEELMRMTMHIELNGPIRATRWPEYGALSVPVRFVVQSACSVRAITSSCMGLLSMTK